MAQYYSKQESLENSIGRPIAGWWMTKLVHSFMEVAPRGIRFSPRISPGATYIGPDDWAGLRRRFNKPYPTDDKSITAQVEEFIHTGTLDTKTALSSTEVTFRDLKVVPKGGALRVETRVEDIPEAPYPYGYLLSGEKLACRDDLDLPRDKNANYAQASMHNLRLGLITGNPNLLTPDVLLSVRRLLSNEITLLPVGIVDTRVLQN